MKDHGLIVTNPDSYKKTQRHVHFSEHVTVHVLDDFNEDRSGLWVIDNYRFKQRCETIGNIISFCLHPDHRKKLYSSGGSRLEE